jgi:flagellar biosynthesis chaperone FliJ
MKSIHNDLETYKKTLAEKISFLQQLRNTITKTETEISMLNGAVQACEKIIADNNGTDGKTE